MQAGFTVRNDDCEVTARDCLQCQLKRVVTCASVQSLLECAPARIAPTNKAFRGFTGTCEQRNNGDAARYDQIANRWLIVMPIFTRLAPRPDQPSTGYLPNVAQTSVIGVAGQPVLRFRCTNRRHSIVHHLQRHQLAVEAVGPGVAPPRDRRVCTPFVTPSAQRPIPWALPTS